MASCSRPGKVAPGIVGQLDHRRQLELVRRFPFELQFSGAVLHGLFGQPCGFVAAAVRGRRRVPAQGPRRWPRCTAGKASISRSAIGPWGISTSGWEDLGQRSDGAYAALNYIWYWQYTQDDAWLRNTGYPYLREVAEFWEDYLKFENGRYVIYNDSIHEGSGPDFNPLLSLGLVRTLFKNMIADEPGVGRGCGPPRQMAGHLRQDQRTFRCRNATARRSSAIPKKAWPGAAATRSGIHHIFPAGAIGLDSDPKLLEISRNMIDAMHRWADYNGFSSWYTACARVGYDPQVILAKLREECDKHSFPNPCCTMAAAASKVAAVSWRSTRCSCKATKA